MLSVLIPVKDFNPVGLVESLAGQLELCGIPYEILVSDDSEPITASETADQLSGMPFVKSFVRDCPLGRSANRNFLARNAIYPYFLFLDGDAGIAGSGFIRKYIDQALPEAVICGGTLYQNEKPTDQETILRWKYGRKREQSDSVTRQKRPWKSFSTFNFLVPASIFHSILFDEAIKGYGHEDTLFGIRLHQSGVIIRHIDNGIFHLGLESAAVYLSKIRESGRNLHFLYTAQVLPEEYAGDISLLATWLRLKKFKIAWLAGAWFSYRHENMEKRLRGSDPSMLLLDLYKLGAISQIG